jgi:glycosyltransferase involved in cell wall biosynthesis
MDYRPNVDATEWFCNEILPIVRAEIPGVNFTICGNRPTTAVRSLARRQGVTVTGWVPDIRPFLARAEIFVAPLRMARGVQNKILEALAMGLPCVASIPAWSGTIIPAGEGILATDNPQQFAEYVICLLQDNAWRAEMASRARGAAEAHYRWEAQMARFDDIIAAVAEAAPGSASAALKPA